VLLLSLAAALLLASPPADSTTVGVSRFVAIDSVHGDTIRGLIWYPSVGAPRQTALGLQDLQVVLDGAYLADRERRPFVIVSHGTGGNELGHWDTAEALVRAGFVVATVRHAGDNSADASALGTDRSLYGRATQVAATLDRLLADSVWGTGWTPLASGCSASPPVATPA
jgi:predicted dienelactone hydrolase